MYDNNFFSIAVYGYVLGAQFTCVAGGLGNFKEDHDYIVQGVADRVSSNAARGQVVAASFQLEKKEVMFLAIPSPGEREAMSGRGGLSIVYGISWTPRKVNLNREFSKILKWVDSLVSECCEVETGDMIRTSTSLTSRLQESGSATFRESLDNRFKNFSNNLSISFGEEKENIWKRIFTRKFIRANGVSLPASNELKCAALSHENMRMHGGCQMVRFFPFVDLNGDSISESSSGFYISEDGVFSFSNFPIKKRFNKTDYSAY
ncbi:hypothetical protein [Nocardiopsis aegyptia]|uniref:Uncharacterized protein n=1 Tax=Nocardiopsis aegyptia TaxID=220378 RepID=A0A7Z0J8T1_9ACTN|nr:hypothetical protein [Nocardiopsis aegyptia]NYJ33438.1 hypothetical protein [Nocardiopsis aegyptia]